jgi:3-phenylpropionate/cinnamic acid dioxygenase small subunit
MDAGRSLRSFVELAEVVARMEIQDVLWRYARGVDRVDLDVLVSVYHPEATDAHTSFSGNGREYARRLVERLQGEGFIGSHHITNMVLELDGPDDARVESYFLAFHPHGDEGAEMGVASGRYLDHFQRRDGEWRILARQVVMDWTRADLRGSPWPDLEGRPIPGRQKIQQDESYTFFDGPPA